MEQYTRNLVARIIDVHCAVRASQTDIHNFSYCSRVTPQTLLFQFISF